MKRQYLFLVFFVMWCIASTWWYLDGVKGVKTDPTYFNPQAVSVSIVEILVMLLVACLLGYGIAWWIRNEFIEEQSESKEKLAAENTQLIHSGSELKSQVEMWREKHQHDLGVSQQKLQEASLDKERLQQQISGLESSVAAAKQELISTKAQSGQTETEIGSLRYRIRQLEFQNKEQSENNDKLKKEVEILLLKKEKAAHSEHPFVRPVEPDEKDDLTKIRGIGPFIEKRLNMIGIYTFEQLGELTPELIDRVGAAIEFFPHRIVRDNWVGQARSFVSR
ncbi:MAG: hypothetical protein QM734_08555 [Cyclobacteriaceae bacterium]